MGDRVSYSHTPLGFGFDMTKASPARIYDCLLGGKDNFAVDRDAADEIRAHLPIVEEWAWRICH